MDAQDVKRRILTRVVLTAGGCLEWQGCKLPKGYGQIRVKMFGEWKTEQAHRLIWRIANGDAGSLFVCHSCDNPACVNIDHLFLGTAKRNSEDMVAKGRSARLRGERSGRAKLSQAQVDGLRRRVVAGESLQSIADSLGIHRSHASRVNRGVRWPLEVAK